jgi:hypothetical protein
MGMLATWVRDSARFHMGSAMPASGDQVVGLLRDWYEYESAYRPKLGYERRSASSAGFRISQQWDERERDDSLDDQLLAARAKVVDACIDKLEPRFRIAIQTHMSNDAAGAQVFRNPRHAESQAADFDAAVAMLAAMLASQGLIDKKLAVRENRA